MSFSHLHKLQSYQCEFHCADPKYEPEGGGSILGEEIDYSDQNQ